MKKLKSVCIFLMAAAVIILGALLPVITGMIQDHTTMGNIDYGDINKLHFELRDMTMAEKMCLIHDSTSVEIIDDDQNGSVVDESESMIPERNSAGEDLAAIFYKAIQPYIQNGLIIDDNYMDKYVVQHILAYDTDDPNISNIFWSINTISDPNGNILNVIIDDQTGIAMALEYITTKPVYDNLSIEDLMWLCYQIYFDSMGVDPKAETYVELVDVDANTGGQIMHIIWQVDDGSTISMELSISEYGFGIYLLDVTSADTEVNKGN